MYFNPLSPYVLDRNSVTNFCKFSCGVIKSIFGKTAKKSHFETFIELLINTLVSPKVATNLLHATSWLETKNVIYIVVHRTSAEFYIGETSLSLRERLITHTQGLATPFAKFFASRMETFIAIPIIFVDKILGDSNDIRNHARNVRKRLESILIKALNPSLNRTYTFPRKSMNERKRPKPKAESTMRNIQLTSTLLNQRIPPTLTRNWTLKRYTVSFIKMRTNLSSKELNRKTPLKGCCLNTILRLIPCGSEVTIETIENGYDISNFGELRKFHSNSILLMDRGNHNYANTEMKRNIFLTRRLIMDPITFILSNPFFVNLEKVNSKKFLATASFNKLVDLLLATETIGDPPTLSHIKLCLRTRFKSKIYKQYVLSIPDLVTIDRRKIMSTIKNCKVLTTLPSQICQIIKERLSISRTTAKSLGDLLLNYKFFDRTFDNQKQVCKCQAGLKEQHKVFFPDEFGREFKKSLVKDVLNLGTAFIPSPNAEAVKRGIRKEIHNLIKKIADGSKTCISSLIHKLKIEEDALIDSTTLEMSRDIITHCTFDVTDAKTYDTSTIQIVRNMLCGWIVSICDKNNQKFIIECPLARSGNIRKTYLENKNYEVQSFNSSMESSKASDKILDSYLKWVDTNKEVKKIFIQNPSKICSFPNSYILRKFKDITRFRPITSYLKHPLKILQKAVSCGLNFLLCSLKVKHFNCDKIGDIRSFIRRMKTFRDVTRAMTGKEVYRFVFDIKEMYTALQHAKIIEALDKLTSYFPHKTLWIPENFKSDDVKWEKISSKYFAISFETALKVVRFELDNAYSGVGAKSIIRQIIGIPQGSPLSQVIARIVVSMDEVNFLQANPDIVSTTRGARYTDDLILLVTSTTPQGVKQRVTEMSKKIYISDLILKEDSQFIFNSAKYVGSHISANGNAMALNKNAAKVCNRA